jgi:TRAP-type mannitol/chloroaromatic compound transport system permease small subunit
MRQLLAVSERLDRIIAGIGKLAAWLLIPLVAIIVVDVISRKFNLLTMLRESLEQSGAIEAARFVEVYLTSTKFQELEWHLHAALFLLCLGFGYVRNSHVRIELVRERFSLRTRAWLEFVGCVIFLLPYSFLVLYFGIDFAERSFEMHEVSSALTGLSHRWIIKSFVPIGMVLLMVALVAVVLRNIVYLFGPVDIQDRAQQKAYELHVAAEELAQAKVKEAERLELRTGGGAA